MDFERRRPGLFADIAGVLARRSAEAQVARGRQLADQADELAVVRREIAGVGKLRTLERQADEIAGDRRAGAARIIAQREGALPGSRGARWCGMFAIGSRMTIFPLPSHGSSECSAAWFHTSSLRTRARR